MLRLRMAALALASGLLLTVSGCCSTCEEGRPFARLFNTSSYRATPMMQPECDCQQGQMPVMLEGTPGPLLTAPSISAGQTMPIPIRDLPTTPPPAFKIPQATSTPYFPPN